MHKAQGHPHSPSVCAGGRQTRAQKRHVSSQVGFILSLLQPKPITWQEVQNHNMIVGITVLRVSTAPSWRKVTYLITESFRLDKTFQVIEYNH